MSEDDLERARDTMAYASDTGQIPSYWYGYRFDADEILAYIDEHDPELHADIIEAITP